MSAIILDAKVRSYDGPQYVRLPAVMAITGLGMSQA